MNVPQFPQGSQWRVWDLHVHTPESLVNGYAGDWSRFLNELEALPPSFKALGINDYLFLDGYRRLIAEKKDNGRLKNIGLLLPVIEFRIAKFGGVEFRNTTRINLHVIFSDRLGPDVIEAQFLSALNSSYCLDASATRVTWSGVVTRESLSKLGADIKTSVPPEKRTAFGGDLIEGFRNLNISEAKIFSVLQDNTFLRDRYLTTVGKSEWDKLDWTEGSIAEKKDIINSVDFVFTSSESSTTFANAKRALIAQNVNSRLLDCSDAHYFADSEMKDRIGNCLTWIKSDPTFDGLAQTLTEFSERVYVGARPSVMERVDQNPTKFATSVKINRTPSALTPDKWFQQEITLNPGLIAVIGRRGSGKSALAEIIALLGNTRRSNEFTFLDGDRFRNPKARLADQFEGQLSWFGNPPSGPMLLSATPSSSDVERVAYLPQLFLERLCNEIAEGESGRFYSELQSVIFSHIPSALQYRCTNLSELIKLKTEERERAIAILNSKLINAISEELKSLRRTGRPQRVEKPPAAGSTQDPAIIELDKLKQRRGRLLLHKERVRRIRDKSASELQLAGKLRGRVNNLRSQFDEAIGQVEQIAVQLKLNPADLVQLTVILEPLKILEERSKGLIVRADVMLDVKEVKSLAQDLERMDALISTASEKLTAAQREYERYLDAITEWRNSIRSLIGTPERANTARGLKAEWRSIATLPSTISALQIDRIAVSEAIFSEKIALQDAFRELHRPVQDFIEASANAEIENQLSFSVSIQENGFTEGFLRHIHQGRIGSFMGQTEGETRVRAILDRADFSTVEGLKLFLNEIRSDLEFDRRTGEPTRLEIEGQLREGFTGEELDNFIFGLGYLKPEFALGWGGKELNQLSPGEKGTLLLVFYLLVDQANIPFVIDQPEENLDNETVFHTLVPCVRKARNRRQVILITHNPNLAVVCDADQIIHAAINKADGNAVTYVSGSIEDKRSTDCW